MQRPKLFCAVTVGFAILACLGGWLAPDCCKAEITYSEETVWSNGRYNAFTDLTRFNDHWYLTFRDATIHGVPPAGEAGGAIRVLEFDDDQTWNSVAYLTDDGMDLRDPKLTVTPDNRLMLLAGATPQSPATDPYMTYTWFSSDGNNWGTPQTVGELDFWLWRAEWHNGTSYAAAYGPITLFPESVLRLYTSTDGAAYQTLISSMVSSPGMALSEAGFEFLADDTAAMVVRRSGTSLIGTSSGDYTDWSFVDSYMSLHCPDLLQLPDGRIVAAGRLVDNTGQHTSLCWLDPTAQTLTPFLELPSNPSDTGYPGMVWENDELWVSYYSAVSGGADIHLARVNIPIPEASTLALALSGFAALAAGRVCRRRNRLRRSASIATKTCAKQPAANLDPS